MKVAVILGVFFLCVVFTVRAYQEEDDFKCEEGVNYQENKCNGCFCNRGMLGCTLMACKSHEDPQYRNCVPGSTWTEGCEKCACSKGWGTVCTVNCGQKKIIL